MTAPNHIVGGFVFTGIMCSLFNINILGSPIYLVTIFIATQLPDADHTKSLIGKIFYPIAKWISVKFGHRTITHSILFLIAITAISYFLSKEFTGNQNLTLIIFFGIFSHLLLDMVTLQGIALFYPFYKHPCVIPANQDLRIRTGNLKQEGIALFIFTILALFMQPLFSKGFWQTYNQQFNSIEHVYRQFKISKTAIKLKYNYTEFQEEIKGEEFIIKAEPTYLILNDSTGIRKIENKPTNKITELLPIVTNKKIIKVNLPFQEIGIDSLNRLVKNKFVKSININSNKNIFLIEPNQKPIKNKIFLESEIYNIQFQSEKEEIKIDNSKYQSSLDSYKRQKENIRSRIIQLNSEIKLERSKELNSSQALQLLKNKVSALESEIRSTNDVYVINSKQMELQQISAKLQSFSVYKSNRIESLQNQISALENQINLIQKPVKEKQQIDSLKISGIIEILTVQ